MATEGKKVNVPLKWFGGKNYLAGRIVALMPKHVHYVEPYFGGGSVLLAKDPGGVSEVVNDLNKDLSWFWKVLQGLDSFSQFHRLCQATPFSELEWNESDVELAEHPDPEYSDKVVRAWRFFVRCRQSLAGRLKSFTAVTRARTRRGMNNETSAWLTCVEGLPAVHERLKRVLILNRPALDVIEGQDGPGVLQYLDPPYLHETRTARDVYAHEMSTQDHQVLLETLAELKGKFLLSGYPSALYDDFAKKEGWSSVDLSQPNHSSGSKSKRVMTERLWANYQLPRIL